MMHPLKVSDDTYNYLLIIGRKGETFDEIIKRIILSSDETKLTNDAEILNTVKVIKDLMKEAKKEIQT